MAGLRRFAGGSLSDRAKTFVPRVPVTPVGDRGDRDAELLGDAAERDAPAVIVDAAVEFESSAAASNRLGRYAFFGHEMVPRGVIEAPTSTSSGWRSTTELPREESVRPAKL